MSVPRHRLAIAGLCLFVAVSGLLLARTASSVTRLPAKTAQWVRTREGWHVVDWDQPRPAREPGLHPGVVAAFVSLASALALIAFPTRRPLRPPLAATPNAREEENSGS